MAAALKNLAAIVEQMQKPGNKKKPLTPTPLAGSPGYRPPLNRPRGTLLSDSSAALQPRKTLLGE